jgi:hypothetical protein
MHAACAPQSAGAGSISMQSVHSWQYCKCREVPLPCCSLLCPVLPLCPSALPRHILRYVLTLRLMREL